MRNNYIILSIVLLLVCSMSHAQDNLAIGQWRSLLPYTTGKYVTQTSEEVWFASDRSILIFDKEEFSTSRFDKVDGLSDVNISVIEFSPENNLFVAAYTNSNIDIIAKDKSWVYNMNDLERDIELQGDKAIYDIYFLDDAAYLATGFGVMKINLTQREVEFTTFMNLKVNNVTSQDGNIYAATDEGVYYASLTGINLLDFGAWDKLDMDEGLPDDYSSRVVHSYNNTLYLDVNDTLFTWTGSGLDYIIHADNHKVNYVQTGQGRLIINLQVLPFGGQRVILLEDNGDMDEPIPFGCLSGAGSSIVEDQLGRLWVGDFGQRVKMFNTNTENCVELEFNSPYSVSNDGMALVDDVLWMAAGSITQGWQYGLNWAGCAKYDKGEWSVYNRFTVPDELDGMLDMVDVEVNPATGMVYIGSFIRGLIVYDGTNFQIYNTENSPLATPTGDTPGNCRVPGLTIDDEGNVWMANHSVSNPIAMLQPDGNWKTFPVTGIQALVEPTIDLAGNKWFTTSNRGLVIFNEGDDIDNHADNRVRFLNPSNSELPTDIVYDIALDWDGDLWVGTSEGVIIFECGGDVFDSSCRGTKRIVEREDGNNAHLLESENVRCIAVDGGNRKWVGTTNGVFLMSEDGLEELQHFTVDNSPLFSNTINDIVINERTGEVYIGTQDGIISYQGDATVGGVVHNADVFAFPNPVQPDYDGPIAIRGLPQNATVKITDISGTLIYETQANGGQAIWDGRDYNGREASSGVYLVFSVNERNLNNPDGFVTKILKMK